MRLRVLGHSSSVVVLAVAWAATAAAQESAPFVGLPVAPLEAPVAPPAVPDDARCTEPTQTKAPANARTADAHALDALAASAEARRVALGLGAASASAAMIATSITYLVVAQVDVNLDPKNAVDTRTGGVVIGLAALVPAAFAAYQLLARSDVEERAAALASGTAPSTVAREIESAGAPIVPVAVGAGLVVGGLGSAALGGTFLALPHIPPHRGPISHATGAELIGLGTAMVGMGALTIVVGVEDTAPQRAALE